MKPSWSDAPKWARWMAMDESGEWIWYEYKPDIIGMYWATLFGHKYQYANKTKDRRKWYNTLEARPKGKRK